jgi:hypothetical protein
VNDAPVAGDAAVSVNEDQALNGTLPVGSQPGQGTGASGTAGPGAGAPAGGGSPASGSGAPAPGSGSLPLGLPVDIHVPPSSLVPADPAGADFIDLNALPPTSAGPATAVGFPLVRLPEAETGFMRLVQSAPETVFGGHRLFVFHGIPNLHFAGDSTSLHVPEDAFAHTDPAALVHLEARLADGRPLPGWLKFDGLRGIFSGEPPRDVRGALEIEVIARDDQGREARTRFILLVEDLQAQGPVRSAEVPDIMLGLDVDAKEAEKQRLEAEKERLEAAGRAAEAKPAEKSKPSAQGTGREVPVSFSEQMKAARAARDPLLDRIARAVQQRPDKP